MLLRPRLLLTALYLLLSASVMTAQTDNASIRTAVKNHFEHYNAGFDIKTLKVERTDINRSGRRLDIYLSDNFSYQQFRKENVDTIYSGLRSSLPAGVRSYSLKIHTKGKTIEQLVPEWSKERMESDNPNGMPRYEGRPWVSNTSRISTPMQGLTNIHLSVTPSHGLYYDNTDSLWEWQRPSLYCTREDLLTQSMVYPFLIPMLENSGATVFCARERDWQTASVTIKSGGPGYREDGIWNNRMGGGYQEDSLRICPDSLMVTTRTTQTASGHNPATSTAYWIPNIPQDGYYGVYVTYQTDSTSIDDARYIVFHSGGSTTLHVNQQMGGGTWVYLGTFHFHKGKSPNGMVTIDNSSQTQGTISADAVRFGGGISTQVRNGHEVTAPRYHYGARYHTKFAGAPDSIFNKYDGQDEYREDIWTRPYMTNWVSGGSMFNQANSGLGVPIELYFALHTDAGYTYGDTLYGSLGICTTDFNDGKLGNGQTRYASRDLTDMVLSQLRQDMPPAIGREWLERGIWDKNYCESREPQMQSMLLELLSHQNFRDICLALNPNFQFTACRAIYKALLKYVSYTHNRDYVVHPLPIDHFRIETTAGGELLLSWQAVPDTLEPTALPTGYIVYSAIDDGGFDNGRFTPVNSFRVRPKEGHIYRFRVTAMNDGGESMPSETLSASIQSQSKGTVLVINGFQRLAIPEVVLTDTTQGFDILSDPGVQYMRSPIMSGVQRIMRLDSIDAVEEVSLGISDSTFNGELLAGNTFDYPYIHGRSIASAGWSFVSCSRESVLDHEVTLNDYNAVDLILGLQKRGHQDTVCHKDYSTFPVTLQEIIRSYTNSGGALLCSGSYVGADMVSDLNDEKFTESVLHYRWEGSLPSATADQVKGMRSKTIINRHANSQSYGVTKPDVISPTGLAHTLFTYSESKLPAGVGFKDRTTSTITLGFPFESINQERERDRIMRAILNYLTDK